MAVEPVLKIKPRSDIYTILLIVAILCLAAAAGAVALAITPMAANWVVRVYGDRVFADTAAFERFLAGGELPEMLAAGSK